MELGASLESIAPIAVGPLDRSKPAASTAPARAAACRLGFGLFLLLNAILFVRPSEIIPALGGLPLYEIVIVACIAASLPVIIERLRPSMLATQPGTVFVLGMLPAIMLSHLVHRNTFDARIAAGEHLKIIAYFLLLVGLVSTQRRLAIFLLTINLMVCVMALLVVLQYQHLVNIPQLAALQRYDAELDSADVQGAVRLQASGIFRDPNDFALMLVTTLIVQAHLMFSRRRPISWRIAGLLPIPLLGYTFALTQSRGGFLALMGGAAAYLWSRFGWKRGLAFAAIVLPILLLLFAGRQTSIDLTDSEDTAQGRILLWREALALFRSAPVFGIGKGQMSEEVGYVAHNSFLHCFAELGVFGGTMFVGAAVVPIMSLRAVCVARGRHRNLTQYAADDWQHCFLAISIAYVLGICALSRAYAPPTYLTFGLAGAYCGTAARATGITLPRLNLMLMSAVLAGSVGLMVFFDIFVRIFAR